MKTSQKSILDLFGLTQMHMQVYLAALELGEGTMQELAHKSGVKRTSIYNFIDELKEKGLIQEKKKKKTRYFNATNPKQLLEIGRSRLSEAESSLPELLAVYNLAKDKPRVTYYEDIDGIKDAYADMLETNQPIVSYEDIDYLKKMLPSKYYEYLPPERARRAIPLRTISKDSPAAREFGKNDQSLLRRTKYIQTNNPLKTEVNIYGNKVLLISFREDRPFATIIEDADIAETLRINWEELWKRLQ